MVPQPKSETDEAAVSDGPGLRDAGVRDVSGGGYDGPGRCEGGEGGWV